MKKTYSHSLLALACLGAATSAMAQSSVTLYGRVNTTIENQRANGSSRSVLQNNASRFGFQGTEDLGGGLKAGFGLESGFNADTGTQTAPEFFARRSEVFLSSGAGTLRLGRFFSEAYFATADFVSMHNHDTGTSADALYAYVGRNQNKIAYRAPQFVPDLSIEGSVSLPEGVPGLKRNYDLAVNYATGGLMLGAGYEQADTDAVGTTRGISRSQGALRALYTAGPFTFGGYVQRDKNAFANSTYLETGNRTNVRLVGKYVLDASEFHINFGAAGKSSQVSDSSARQLTLAYNYNLSKRTKVYAFLTKINDSSARLYGGDFRSVALGMRHNF
ncbi:porin [Xylophilus sp. ASV27]|uniref:porin n=1 Tax=Xylophilus sp. ASV27 TaxID=2795129 RepID=UPI0018EB270F|nr:porin [Xylophilus sp. ASV27]